MRSPSLPASATACDQQCVSPVRCVLLRSPHRPPLAACDQQRASPVLCFLHRSPHRPPCATNSVPRRCVASCIAMDHSIGGSLALPDTIGGSYRSEGREFESLCSYLGALRQSIFFCRCLRRGGLFEFHSGYSSVGRRSDQMVPGSIPGGRTFLASRQASRCEQRLAVMHQPNLRI